MPRLLTLLVIAGALVASTGYANEADEYFEKHVRPLLVAKCVECHAGMTPEGKLDLSSAKGFQAGGMAGPLVDGADLESSLLYERLITTDEDLLMPPDDRLSEAEPKIVADWLKAGAHWPESAEMPMGDSGSELKHWAFQPIAHPSVPATADDAWCWNEIDRFLKHRMEQDGIAPVGDAPAETWLRRVTIDLTGLPPTIEEQARFASGQETRLGVVRRLMASRAYGERQARRWLDVARYADTSGDGTDTPIPEARYYRDWVIDAFTSDMPYDEFLIEQLAGDILAKQSPDDPDAFQKTIATGYIALSRRFGNSRFAEMHQIIDDTIDTVGKSTMGLSLGCARCHHHKFDPVTMEDYYGLYGYFASTQYPHAGTEHQKDRSDMPAIHVPEHLKDQYESDVAWAVADKEKPADEKVRIAGDPSKKGDVAPRGYLGFLTAGAADIPAGESGRLQFAQWVVSAENPLTARVMVNRIWQSHFGKGLVSDANNFGVQSPPPSHPELLDYLATEFIESGWSVKHIHRLIVSSHAYSLSSKASDEQLARDEANETLRHFPRQRMDADTFRDSILAVSGKLEAGSGGRHPFKPTEKLKYSQGSPFNEIFDHDRRSVYLMAPRLNRHPMMALFDAADANVTTGKRAESTVPLQSLFVLNGEFVREKSAAFADRVIDAAASREDRIAYAWQLAFGRSPDASELEMLSDYLDSHIAAGDAGSERIAWASVSRVILGSNEFMYIDYCRCIVTLQKTVRPPDWIKSCLIRCLAAKRWRPASLERRQVWGSQMRLPLRPLPNLWQRSGHISRPKPNGSFRCFCRAAYRILIPLTRNRHSTAITAKTLRRTKFWRAVDGGIQRVAKAAC